MFFAAKRACSLRITVGEFVERSNHAAPACMVSISSSAMASTSRGPGSEVNTTSDWRATSPALSAHVAPPFRCAAAASRRRSLTTSSNFAFCTLSAIDAPIVPKPMNPTRMMSDLYEWICFFGVPALLRWRRGDSLYDGGRSAALRSFTSTRSAARAKPSTKSWRRSTIRRTRSRGGRRTGSIARNSRMRSVRSEIARLRGRTCAFTKSTICRVSESSIRNKVLRIRPDSSGPRAV